MAPLKILIIDDDRDDAALASRLLTPECETHVISSSAQLAEELFQPDFDVALIESKVQWADCLTLLGTLKKRAPARPVLLFTAQAGDVLLSAALQQGLDGFVLKTSRGYASLPEALRAARQRTGRPQSATDVSIHQLLDQSGTPLFQCTLEGRFVEGNAAFVTLLRVSPSETMDLNVLDLVLPGGPRRELIAQLRRDRSLRLPDVTLTPRGGSSVKCSLIATLTDEEGAAPLVTGLLEPRPAPVPSPAPPARSSVLAEKALGAAHDLKEPLRTLEHYSETLRKRYRGRLDSDADEFLAYIHDAARRMKTQIAQLFQEVAAEAAPPAPPRAPEPHPVAPLPTPAPPSRATTNTGIAFERALANLRASITAAGGKVTHGPLGTLPLADDELLQLFQNLIGNAVKFHGEQPPRVHVSVSQTGKDWLVSVEDNGMGVSAEDAPRLFSMFGRGRAAEGRPGSGIGLALCKSIVERHGGRIWASPNSDRGATFFFSVPVSSRAAAPQRSSSAAGAARPMH
jgi:signal transduction histidine kinase